MPIATGLEREEIQAELEVSFFPFPISKSYALSCQETDRILMFPYSGI